MEKPAIFFSHSSKDKEFIIALKEKIDKITSGTLDIFMSSDGQSIPFGNNWLHQIEVGLHKSEIMFVFVTKNSLSSGWIYFEAGFGYSKGIKVIPIGFGVDIGSIKPPLNLLQGFNVISNEGLNNFIKIINDYCGFSFPESFKATDYANIVALADIEQSHIFDLAHYVDHLELEIPEKYMVSEDVKYRDLNSIMESFKTSLDDRDIGYAFINDEIKSQILTRGINIKYIKDRIEQSHNGHIYINLSTLYFLDNFNLLVQLLEPLDGFNNYYMKLLLQDFDTIVIDKHEDITSMIMSKSKEFDYNKDSIGEYYYENESYRFKLDKHIITRRDGTMINDSCIKVIVPMEYDSGSKLISIVNSLAELKIIQ